MRMTTALLIACSALAVLAGPSLARNVKPQKADTEDTGSSCSSYQLGPDGNWAQLPCREVGGSQSSQQQQRTPPKSHDEPSR
jgi:hypothetical protein